MSVSRPLTYHGDSVSARRVLVRCSSSLPWKAGRAKTSLSISAVVVSKSARHVVRRCPDGDCYLVVLVVRLPAPQHLPCMGIYIQEACEAAPPSGGGPNAIPPRKDINASLQSPTIGVSIRPSSRCRRIYPPRCQRAARSPLLRCSLGMALEIPPRPRRLSTPSWFRRSKLR